MIIGFSGFARAGKNTAAEEFAKLTEAECKHFISIIHVFSCRIYGLRKYSDKIKKDKEQEMCS